MQRASFRRLVFSVYSVNYTMMREGEAREEISGGINGTVLLIQNHRDGSTDSLAYAKQKNQKANR
jgi:hypothetical protein